MHRGGGSVAAKAGAEGVHGVAAIAPEFGYVSKVLDGAGACAGPVDDRRSARAWARWTAEQAAELARFAAAGVYNRAGRAVGEIRVSAVAVEKASIY